MCACVCVNATCDPVSILAVCILWREALEQSQIVDFTVPCSEAMERAEGYTYFVHQYNRASMLHHCLHALMMCRGSLLANSKSCAWTVSETEKRFSRGGYGRRDFHLQPLISLRAFFQRCYCAALASEVL